MLNVVYKPDAGLYGGPFELSYDLIVLDESESLMSHFDEGTMNNKDVETRFFFNEIMKHAKKVVLMDGDVSQRTLRLASSYGNMICVRNNNNETNNIMNIIKDPAKLEAGLLKDIDEFKS
ncbi:MAG: hypothetical protein ACKPKO_61525, partial [Candidatus Fonsibacter sp.]